MAFTFTTVFAGTDTFIATAFSLDADTAGTLIHNLALTAAQLAAGPEIVVTPLGTGMYVGQWSVGAIAANTLPINKINAANSGGGGVATVQIEIRRPHTIGR